MLDLDPDVRFHARDGRQDMIQDLFGRHAESSAARRYF
jgi:hypothetical protein